MDFDGSYYSKGFSDGQFDVYCALLCHGFDEQLLQKFFSISDEDLHNIILQADYKLTNP